MKHLKKLSLVLCLAMLAASFAGCGAKQSSNEQVTLNWMILVPGNQPDQQMVWDKFNEELAKVLPNTTVNFLPVINSEYKKRFDLALAGGDPLDIAFAGWLVPLAAEVRKGSFLELNELLDKYGKDVYKSMDEWVWKLTTIDDGIYAVPNNQGMAKGRFSMITHKEYADKYLDAEKIQKIFEASDTFDEPMYDAIEEYLEKLKQNGVLGKGINTTFMPGVDVKGFDAVEDRYYVRRGDDSYQIEYKWLIPESKLMFQKAREFFKKGYVRKDMLSLETPRKDEGKEDGYTVWFTQYTKDQSETLTIQNGYPTTAIPMSQKFFLDGGAIAQTSTAIPYTSKNPERAMQLINLIFSEKGKDLYNLLTFGIEGVHYNKVSGDVIRPVDYEVTPKADSKYGLNKWVAGNSFLAYSLAGEPDGYNDYLNNEVNRDSDKSPLLGFRFDNTNVKVEMAQVQAIASEFILPLSTGAIEDAEAQYDLFVKKLKDAGVEKVKAEMQKQLDEFVKKNLK